MEIDSLAKKRCPRLVCVDLAMSLHCRQAGWGIHVLWIALRGTEATRSRLKCYSKCFLVNHLPSRLVFLLLLPYFFRDLQLLFARLWSRTEPLRVVTWSLPFCILDCILSQTVFWTKRCSSRSSEPRSLLKTFCEAFSTTRHFFVRTPLTVLVFEVTLLRCTIA